MVMPASTPSIVLASVPVRPSNSSTRKRDGAVRFSTTIARFDRFLPSWRRPETSTVSAVGEPGRGRVDAEGAGRGRRGRRHPRSGQERRFDGGVPNPGAGRDQECVSQNGDRIDEPGRFRPDLEVERERELARDGRKAKLRGPARGGRVREDDVRPVPIGPDDRGKEREGLRRRDLDDRAVAGLVRVDRRPGRPGTAGEPLDAGPAAPGAEPGRREDAVPLVAPVRRPA